MEESARFSLPFLAPGQAQKEWWHNEALQTIDLLLCPVVEGAALAAPPASPAVGACYLVASGASGAWAGKDGMLAGYTDGGWKFVAPTEGTHVLDSATGQLVIWRSGAWESGILRAQELQVDGQAVVRGRQPAIAGPSGGSVIDSECRAVVSSLLAAAKAHGLIG